MSRLKLICESAAKSRREMADPVTKLKAETYVCEAEFQAAPNSPENAAFFPTQQGAFLRLQGYMTRFRFGDLVAVDIQPVKDAPSPAAGTARLRFTCHHGKVRRVVQQSPAGERINAVVCDAEFFPTPSAEENKPFFHGQAAAFLKIQAGGPEFEGADEYFVDIAGISG